MRRRQRDLSHWRIMSANIAALGVGGAALVECRCGKEIHLRQRRSGCVGGTTGTITEGLSLTGRLTSVDTS